MVQFLQIAVPIFLVLFTVFGGYFLNIFNKMANDISDIKLTINTLANKYDNLESKHYELQIRVKEIEKKINL